MKTEPEIRKRLDELHGPLDDYPTGTDLLEWVLEPSPVIHEGVEKDRCEHKHDGWFNKEKLFADKWKETNNPPHFLNGGVGTLAWILCSSMEKNFIGQNEQRITRHLTQEEATVAASAIQWLGTNCGWCWLEECIRDCGFDIVRRREPR